MNHTPPGSLTHYLAFERATFREIDDLPIEGYGQTLQEIASDDAYGAYRLLHEILIQRPDIVPRADVETYLGRVSTARNGEVAARNAFMAETQENFMGSAPLYPVTVEISEYRDTRAFDGEDDKIVRLVKRTLVINVVPPYFDT